MTLNMQEEVNKLRARYLDAFALGDSGICTLVTASYLLGLPYQEVRDRMVYEYNLRTPLDLLTPESVKGYPIVAAHMTNEFWRRVMGLPLPTVPTGKRPLYAVQVWPTCIYWTPEELEDLTGAAIVWHPTSNSRSSTLLHMTPVVSGWSLDHFGTGARGPAIPIEPCMAGWGVEVVHAQPFELR